MFLDKTQTTELENLIEQWLQGKGIQAGAKVTVEFVPNKSIIFGGNAGRKTKTSKLRDLSEEDWSAIFMLAPSNTLDVLKLLKKRSNRGVKPKDFPNSESNYLGLTLGRLNKVFVAHKAPYRLTWVCGNGNSIDGPFQIGVLY